MADSFPFELVSPERLLVSEQVEAVVIPGSEGEMTVMAHHAPLMTVLKPGVIRVRNGTGAETRYLAFGGFADITPEGCTVLAEAAMPAEQFSRADLDARIAAVQAELDAAENDQHRTKLEEFLANLSHIESHINT
ncbi:MAG: F0F1 ATP synthase subunit epsilon [Methylobacterium mesophilicum]|nr:F0F1 ATP synthase subunit epsilon [Methylobacterium mesophilicum]